MRVKAKSQWTEEQKRDKVVPSNRCRSKFMLFLWERPSLCAGNMRECVCLSLATFSNPRMGRNRKDGGLERWLGIRRVNGEKDQRGKEAESLGRVWISS